MGKLTLDLDAITVTTFETAAAPATNNVAATIYTGINCCGGTGCNTRLTCSTNLC
ncbi:MAG TPA: hypothetical protein VFS20_18160 [Longimicrobium sp.]|nr:hypothetical protein [Longimicrobium sp.]